MQAVSYFVFRCSYFVVRIGAFPDSPRPISVQSSRLPRGRGKEVGPVRCRTGPILALGHERSDALAKYSEAVQPFTSRRDIRIVLRIVRRAEVLARFDEFIELSKKLAAVGAKSLTNNFEFVFVDGDVEACGRNVVWHKSILPQNIARCNYKDCNCIWHVSCYSTRIPRIPRIHFVMHSLQTSIGVSRDRVFVGAP